MNDKYQIIRYHPKGKEYHAPNSKEYYDEFYKFYQENNFKETLEEIIGEHEAKYDHHTAIEIPLGASRIGGPIIDKIEDFEYPEGYFFMAQLDMKQFSKHDPFNFLPKSGYLYFFVKDYGDNGLVYYHDVKTEQLRRDTVIHENWYYSGRLIGEVKEEVETWSSRYRINEEGQTVWGEFQGADMSKIYGIATNVQAEEEQIIEKMVGQILLLQIGEDFLEEGVHCVYIDEKDLLNRDFSKCIFDYSQT